ncbi:DUF736 domain-containing protein [Sphingopyxis indica]|uniref:Uncharacterized conserved protein, DUF736 family n=1 Tax=Sphingopyxis indica TaxID=436663 RepID=A0A239IP34_9SPHN|nr:DUF736 domain-containing protein [Sphingopyxis indica]SNS95546.1 Uncharacterized conserved protein, DUF736 family [Sphingopyxis indica]
MQIGCFKEDGDGFAGRLRTLTLDVALRLVPTGFTGHDRAPDWRVHLADNGAPETIGPEVGSGWNHDGKTGAFVTLQLDCPGFARPIRANLLRSNRGDDGHVLLWSPRLRRPKAE